MTADDRSTDERERERDRGGSGGAFGIGFGAGIRAFRGLFGGSSDRSRSGTSPDDLSAAGKRFARRGSGNRESNGRTRTKRIRVTGPDDCLTETRREEGAFVVAADVIGTDPGDLSVYVDHGANDLLILEGGRLLDRVALPWRSVEPSEGRLNNGVLEVHLRPADGEAT